MFKNQAFEKRLHQSVTDGNARLIPEHTHLSSHGANPGIAEPFAAAFSDPALRVVGVKLPQVKAYYCGLLTLSWKESSRWEEYREYFLQWTGMYPDTFVPKPAMSAAIELPDNEAVFFTKCFGSTVDDYNRTVSFSSENTRCVFNLPPERPLFLVASDEADPRSSALKYFVPLFSNLLERHRSPVDFYYDSRVLAIRLLHHPALSRHLEQHVLPKEEQETYEPSLDFFLALGEDYATIAVVCEAIRNKQPAPPHSTLQTKLSPATYAFVVDLFSDLYHMSDYIGYNILATALETQEPQPLPSVNHAQQ